MELSLAEMRKTGGWGTAPGEETGSSVRGHDKFEVGVQV